jgi:PKD repeat protein
MKKLFFLITSLSLLLLEIYAQCPTSLFNVGPVCLGDSVTITNSLSNNSIYEWDFCSGELGLGNITRTPLTTLNAGSSILATKIVSDSGQYFLFALTSGNILFRLDFGNSLQNIPQSNNLGVITGLNAPNGVDFVKESNNWYALVTNTGASGFLRLLSFGSSLTSTPSSTAISLPSGTLASPRGVAFALDGDSLVAIVANNTASRIRLLNFGSSILNPITAVDTLGIPHNLSSGAYNVAVIRDCNNWFAVVNSFSNGRVNRMNLGSQIFDMSASVDSITTSPIQSVELELVNEGGEFKAFFNTYTTSSFRLNYLHFGQQMSNNPTLQFVNYGGVGPTNTAFCLGASNSKWVGFFISSAAPNQVNKLDFFEPCQAQPIISNGQNNTVKYLTSGSFTASVVGSDPITGSKAASKSITINPGPIANFGYAQACEGQTTLFFDSTVTVGTTLGSTSWTFGNGGNSSAINPTTNYANAGTYPVQLIKQTVNGCADTITKQVIVSDIPVANFSSSVSCQRDSAIFLDLSNSIDSLIAWQWNFGNASTSNSKNPVQFIDTAGNLTVSLIVTNLGGCKDTTEQPIFLNPKPDFTITVENTCVGETVDFLNNTTVKLGGQIATSNWNFGDGASATSFQANHTYLPDTANYNVVYTATTNAGCLDSFVFPIRISTPPIPDFSAGTACSGVATNFTDLSSGASDTVYQWIWDFGNGDTSFVKNPSQVFAAPGNYTVKLIAISPTFCDSAISKTVTVLPSPTINISADSVCSGLTTTFTNNSTIANPNTIQSWLWNFGDGNSSSLQNPVNAYSQAGLYNASLQATSDSGCSSINNLVVFVKYQPVANFTPSGITCAQSATQFFNQSSVLFPGTISNYSWDFGDNNTDTAANPIHVYNNQNFYPVKLIVVSNDGCSDTATQTIEVFAPFDVDFEFENICLGDTVSFSDVTNSFSIINRQWNFGDGSFFVSEKNPKHKFNVADTYVVTLQAENAIGCIDTTSKSVVIVEKPKADFTNLIGCEDASYAPLDNSTSAEAITNRLWLINGSFYNSATPQFTYSDTGIYPIQLTVKTQSGCVDSITKNISIKPRPTAAFGFTPLYGEAPVEITGINQSTGSSTYEWSFGDGDFSADENPKHTYTQNGTYTIQLKAISAFGCEDSISLSYLVIPTDLDIAVTEITTNQVVLPDGNIAVSITAKVSNLGTRQITNYTLYANVGSGGVITETWNGLLSSGQTMLYTFTAKFILSNENAETYVCVKATDVNNGEAEIALFNNQQCTPLTEMWQIAGPTPNPSSGASNVGIILPKAGTVTVSIIDLMGRIVWPAQELNLPAGRTDYALPIQQLLGAEYFIQLTYNDEKTVRKLFVRK